MEKFNKLYKLIISNKTCLSFNKELRNIFSAYKIEEKDIVRINKGEKEYLEIYFVSKNKAVKLYQEFLRIFPEQELSIEKVELSNWWQENFSPFNITPNLLVSPLNFTVRDEKRRIFLDNKPVFGCGNHPTTKMLALFIEGLKGEFESFLDIGSGSGILSLVAYKNGAKKIWAVEKDSYAAAVARRNFHYNKITNIRIYNKTIEDVIFKNKFDLVAANLETLTLIKLQKLFVEIVSRGKYLILSGVAYSKEKYFQDNFILKEMVLLKKKKRKGWLAYLYKKVKIKGNGTYIIPP